MTSSSDKLEFRAKASADLTSAEREEVHALFGKNYKQADHNYLDNSLDRLRNIALALDKNQLVGFSVSDNRLVAIPGIAEPQLVALGGIGCRAI